MDDFQTATPKGKHIFRGLDKLVFWESKNNLEINLIWGKKIFF